MFLEQGIFMNVQPTLVILAAGIGSRYQGMKQIDGVGNHGEPIIDFSIYDAKEAGFNKVVLIIQKQHEELFRKILTDDIEKSMEVAFAYQDIHNLPEGIAFPEGREKPWGTTFALLSCEGIVNEPFAIINADDYYGKSAYRTMYQYLTEDIKDTNYAMIGYRCINTLTEHGTVTRGVCQVDENQNLTSIKETYQIRKSGDKVTYENEDSSGELDPNSLVSMNFWGFTPTIFKQIHPLFTEFLQQQLKDNPLTCEHVLPTAIGTLVEQKECTVKVLNTNDSWFGVTYKEDRDYVIEKIQELKNIGAYPDVLW